jgi:Protoporphyrinogen oxidase
MANAPGAATAARSRSSARTSRSRSTTGSAHPAGLGSIPAERHGEEVAVIGAGISGLVAAYELMKLGVKPVVYEASQMGGRLRSQPFEGAKGVVAELGGMRSRSRRRPFTTTWTSWACRPSRSPTR